jgi:MFS family permease
MLSALGPFRPILLAAMLMMVGQGLMGTVLPVRLAELGASAQIAGLVTAAYFLGQVIGTRLGNRLMARAGLIRGFAAVIAAACVCILLIPMVDTPWAWMILRLASGIFTVLALLVMESWLNMASDNATRGSVFSAYMVVAYVGLTLGQVLIGFVDASTFVPFSVASMMLMLAILPMTLTQRAQPELPPATRLRLVDLARISPVGIAACVASGALTGAMFGLFPFYASSQGYSSGGVATFMAAVIGGGLVLNWPLGRLSESVDRRLVIGFAAGLIVLTSITLVIGGSSLTTLVAARGLMGGAAAALYSLGVAHTNDYVGGIDAVAVAAGLLLAFGLGAITGPMVASGLMDLVEPVALFAYTGAVGAALGLLSLFRLVTHRAVGGDDKIDFVALSQTTAVPLAMNFGTDEHPAADQFAATDARF